MAEKIGKFSLKNHGGFVCRAKFNYVDERGRFMETTYDSGDILLGQERDIDPAHLGVPNGAQFVWLYVDVVWGYDKMAEQSFSFEAGSPKKARYIISGTTISNELTLSSVD